MPIRAITKAQQTAQNIFTREAQNFAMRKRRFIFDELLARPNIDVSSGTYFQDDLNFGLDTLAPGDGSTATLMERYEIGNEGRNSAEWEYSPATFSTVPQGMAKFRSDLEEAEYQRVRAHSLRQRDRDNLMLALMTDFEKQVHILSSTAGNWTTSVTPSTLWDAAGGAVLEDIDTGANQIEDDIAWADRSVNIHLVMGRGVRSGMRRNSTLISDLQRQVDFMHKLGKNATWEAALATYLDLAGVHTFTAVRGNEKEGETAARTNISGNFALLAVLAPGADDTEAALVDFRFIDFVAGETRSTDDAPNTAGASSWVDLNGKLVIPRAQFGYHFASPVS